MEAALSLLAGVGGERGKCAHRKGGEERQRKQEGRERRELKCLLNPLKMMYSTKEN